MFNLYGSSIFETRIFPPVWPALWDGTAVVTCFFSGLLEVAIDETTETSLTNIPGDEKQEKPMGFLCIMSGYKMR